MNTSTPPEIVVLSDLVAVAAVAAERLAEAAQGAIAERGRFTVALSGGSTPRALFELLAEPAWLDRLSWEQFHVYWVDERCVPPSDPQSNYGVAQDLLLSKVPIPAAQVYRMRGEDDPESAARAYEAIVRETLPASPDGWPRLDLILLGIGPDGHTASLFPGSPYLGERERAVVAPYVEKLRMSRVTLTPPVLNAGRAVIFLAAGADKAGPLKGVLEQPDGPPAELPARVVHPHPGTLTWLVDQAAAALRHEA